MDRELRQELGVHPWFILSNDDDAVGLTIDLTGDAEATPRLVEGLASVMVPEVNGADLSAAPAVIGIPDGASAALAIALKPLQKVFGLRAVRVVVMAGPGIGPNNAGPDPALGLRVERETRHLLSLSDAVSCSVEAIHLPLSQQTVQRVSVTLEEGAICEGLKQVWEKETNPLASLKLPSAPDKVIHLWDGLQGPPPSLGQLPSLQVQIGRVQECPIFGFKFVITSTMRRRGTLLLAELLVKMGKIYW